jgi:hypothetical protein
LSIGGALARGRRSPVDVSDAHAGRGIGRRILERAVLAEGYYQTNVLTGKGPRTATKSFISQRERIGAVRIDDWKFRLID